MAERSRILVVDDEEAILETMGFTFEDDYDVLTARSAERGLQLLDQHAPVAVVISDQRMPEMTGVEFLRKVWERHPTTVRMILTGFADMDAIVQAINDGHVYAYIAKPWEPDELKQVVRRAVEHHRLSLENERLLDGLREANAFLEAVMDQLDTGALAVDAAGRVRAINQPARANLGMTTDPRGARLRDVLEKVGAEWISDVVDRLAADPEIGFEEVDLPVGDRTRRLRITVQGLERSGIEEEGRVILLKEISHEPLQRRFDEVLASLEAADDSLRPPLEKALPSLRALAEEVRESGIESPGMAEAEERVSRTLTAVEHWLAVDDALAKQSYPDAQLLRERMRIALARWPLPDRVPDRVRNLARSVETYYETGENPKRPIL